jgi:hypothetical protein
MFAMVRPGYGIACLAKRAEYARDTAWHAGVTRSLSATRDGHQEEPMNLPRPEHLYTETERRYSRYADAARAARGLEGGQHARDEQVWLAIREQVLDELTTAAFDAYFPTAGELAAEDIVLIDYWNDIKQQISGEPGRWSWDSPPDPAS